MLLIVAQANFAILAIIFSLAGIYVAGAEALEDSLAAALVYEADHVGVLATVNGIGDLVSSLIVGFCGWASERK